MQTNIIHLDTSNACSMIAEEPPQHNQQFLMFIIQNWTATIQLQLAFSNVHHNNMNRQFPMFITQIWTASTQLQLIFPQRSSPQHNWQFPMIITQNSPAADSWHHGEGKSAPCIEIDKNI